MSFLETSDSNKAASPSGLNTDAGLAGQRNYETEDDNPRKKRNALRDEVHQLLFTPQSKVEEPAAGNQEIARTPRGASRARTAADESAGSLTMVPLAAISAQPGTIPQVIRRANSAGNTAAPDELSEAAPSPAGRQARQSPSPILQQFLSGGKEEAQQKPAASAAPEATPTPGNAGFHLAQMVLKAQARDAGSPEDTSVPLPGVSRQKTPAGASDAREGAACLASEHKSPAARPPAGAEEVTPQVVPASRSRETAAPAVRNETRADVHDANLSQLGRGSLGSEAAANLRTFLSATEPAADTSASRKPQSLPEIVSVPLGNLVVGNKSRDRGAEPEAGTIAVAPASLLAPGPPAPGAAPLPRDGSACLSGESKSRPAQAPAPAEVSPPSQRREISGIQISAPGGSEGGRLPPVVKAGDPSTTGEANPGRAAHGSQREPLAGEARTLPERSTASGARETGNSGELPRVIPAAIKPSDPQMRSDSGLECQSPKGAPRGSDQRAPSDPSQAGNSQLPDGRAAAEPRGTTVPDHAAGRGSIGPDGKNSEARGIHAGNTASEQKPLPGAASEARALGDPRTPGDPKGQSNEPRTGTANGEARKAAGAQGELEGATRVRDGGKGSGSQTDDGLKARESEYGRLMQILSRPIEVAVTARGDNRPDGGKTSAESRPELSARENGQKEAPAKDNQARDINGSAVRTDEIRRPAGSEKNESIAAGQQKSLPGAELPPPGKSQAWESLTVRQVPDRQAVNGQAATAPGDTANTGQKGSVEPAGRTGEMRHGSLESSTADRKEPASPAQAAETRSPHAEQEVRIVKGEPIIIRKQEPDPSQKSETGRSDSPKADTSDKTISPRSAASQDSNKQADHPAGLPGRAEKETGNSSTYHGTDRIENDKHGDRREPIDKTAGTRAGDQNMGSWIFLPELGIGRRTKIDENKAIKGRREQTNPENRQGRRAPYVVSPGDTLESIAISQLKDVRFAVLLLAINRGAIKFRSQNELPVPDLRPGQILWLPTPAELSVHRKNFFGSRPANSISQTAIVSESGAPPPMDAIALPELTICQAAIQENMKDNRQEALVTPSPETELRLTVTRLADSCRLVTADNGQDSGDFTTRLELSVGNRWSTVASYEFRLGRAVLWCHNFRGAAQSLVMDLPSGVIRDMSREDFARNWATYCLNYTRSIKEKETDRQASA